MKLRNIGLAGVLGGLGVIASSMAAQALDFNFSFNGNQGTNPGIVTGIIRGLDNNGGAANATVDVISSPFGSLGGYSFISGSFQITNGEISHINAVRFFNVGTESNIYFNNGIGTNGLYLDSGNVFNNGGAPGVTYTAATAVPFDFNPTEGAVLGIPLFVGLGILRKKKLAQKSAAKKVAELVS